MASKISFASFTILFFITTFSIFTGEASVPTSPETSPATPPSSSSSSSETTCDTDYLNRHMIAIAEKTKEFIRKYLKPRNEEKDKMEEKNKECLYKVFNSYEGALGIVEHAIGDLSLKRYSNVIKALEGYQSTVASTLVCPEGADLITVNPEFRGMEEWTHFSIEDVIKRLKACSSNLSEL